MALKTKDLLGLRDISREEIEEILNTAAAMKQVVSGPTKKTSHLQGKSIVTLFYENSTRTRLSFELASKYMSAVAANIAASSSSVKKGETLIDTAQTIDMMGTDVIIMRHPMSGAPHIMAKHVKSAIINAGDGTNEHPTQALLDMMTIREKKGGFEGLKVAVVGDVVHSRVARSNVYGLTKMGAKVVLAGPPTLLPAPGCEIPGVDYCYRVEDAVRDADVVMALRIQLERQKKGLFPSVREYARYFGIDPKMMQLARPDALVMHPGPMNRGVEISSYVADSDQSLINEQVTNGVAVRMALLYMMTRRDVRCEQ
ncbi:MAG: aspartate carbamoyltransferase catalytic subunit [Candidatus Fimivivens sp.]